MIVAAGALFLAFTAGQTPAPFVYWSPRPGLRLEYKFKLIREKQTHEWTTPYRIKEVVNGIVHLQELDVTYGLTLRGNQLEEPPDHRIGSSLLGGFRYPDKKLELNETWRASYAAAPPRGAMAAKVEVTYHGTVGAAKLNARKFTYKFLLANGVSSKGTVWIATDDGTLLRRESWVRNYRFGPPSGPEDFREEVTLVDRDWWAPRGDSH